MRILSVEASNFRSYSTLKWSIPSAGLYLIDGENLDTGRNNMTGKTTLVDAIFWATFGYLPKWGGPKGGPVDAVIKRGSAKCVAQVNILNDGKNVFIRRERPNKLFIEVDGIEIQGKSGDLDSRIPGLIGMTAEQFLTAVYVSQDRKQSFFTMGEADRTQLLSEISKVENINRSLENAKKTKSDLELQIEKQKSVIETLEAQYSGYPMQFEKVEIALAVRKANVLAASNQLASADIDAQERFEVTKSNVDYRKAQLVDAYEQAKANHTIHLKEQEAELSILEAEIIQAPRMDLRYTQEIEVLKVQLAEANASNLSASRINAENSIARAALKNIADEIEATMNGKCDHCNQDLPGDMREKHIADLMARVPRWEQKIKDVPAPLDVDTLQTKLNEALQAYSKRKAELEAAPKQKETEANSLRMGVQLSRQSLAALDRNHRFEMDIEERKLADAKTLSASFIADAKNALLTFEKVLEQEIEFKERLKQERDLADDKLRDNKVKAFTLNESLDQALDLIDLFKGFRQVCFEDLIARISDRAGDLLSLMTDGIYNTRIDQMGETSKGEAKLILKPMITKGGQDVPMDDLSGGARRTTMLAYDVAVAEAVGDSSVLFLDEALDGLDTIGKSEAMRLLEEVSRNKAVFVIDHSSEIKASFNQIIKVSYKDGTSTLESA